MKKKKPTILFICGATGTGKSDLAEQIYDCWGGTIVNFDSVQVYKGLDIGSAKPTRKQREQRSHALYDFVPKGDVLTAGGYRKKALNYLNQNSHSFFIFVGGSGFYQMALEKGLLEIPELAKEKKRELEEEFEYLSHKELYERVLKKDPEWAKKIDPNDLYRIKRSLFMLASIEGTLSECHRLHQQKPGLESDYHLIKIGLTHSRESLSPRIAVRTKKMLELGLIDEYESLLDEGLVSWPPMGSVGYKEVGQYLQGAFKNKSELTEEIVKNTLRLAKRQKTWFKRDKNLQWFDNAEEAMKSLDERSKEEKWSLV